MATSDLIKAAGGLIGRNPAQRLEIALIHHTRDGGEWCLPKSKLNKGEPWEQAAPREVLEETGFQCDITVPAGPVSHIKEMDVNQPSKKPELTTSIGITLLRIFVGSVFAIVVCLHLKSQLIEVFSSKRGDFLKKNKPEYDICHIICFRIFRKNGFAGCWYRFGKRPLSAVYLITQDDT